MWVPPNVEAELAGERQAHNAQALAAVELADHLKEWDRELQAIDPHLQLVKARMNTTVPGLRPGYYHVLRHNPGAPVTFFVHEGPKGEYREPDSGLFERLRQADLWSDRSLRAREEAAIADAAAKAREREREREALRDEAAERWRQKHTTQISVPRGV